MMAVKRRPALGLYKTGSFDDRRVPWTRVWVTGGAGGEETRGLTIPAGAAG
jgi:hypothetical protein